MAHWARPALTAEQKREMWSRWKAGQSLSQIGRALGRERSAIHRMVATTGGYAPADRNRSPRVLSSAEREEISRGLAEGLSLRTIARRSGRAPSTISREVARHGGRHHYRATQADERAWQRARRPKRCKLATSPALRELVATKLALDWSPQQISGWLARTYPRAQALRVLVEGHTQPQPLRAGPGVLRKELLAHLRTRRSIRRCTGREHEGRGPRWDFLFHAVSIPGAPGRGRGPGGAGGMAGSTAGRFRQQPHRHPRGVSGRRRPR